MKLAQARAIAAQLGEVGIDVTANPQPKQQFFAKIHNRETDFFFDSWLALDSESVFQQFYRAGSPDAAGYSNAHVDELIHQIDRTMITYGRDALIERSGRSSSTTSPTSRCTTRSSFDNLDLPIFSYNRPLFREARFRQPKVN